MKPYYSHRKMKVSNKLHYFLLYCIAENQSQAVQLKISNMHFNALNFDLEFKHTFANKQKKKKKKEISKT